MYYQRAIEKTLVYIENSLCLTFTLDDLVLVNGFSRCHFSRLFHLFTGYSISEYIKKRRLSEAAKQLVETDLRIIDIAMVFQFSSQESFTRAFQQLFSLTPGRYRKQGKKENMIEPLDIKKIIWMSGGLEMKPKIVNLQPLKVVGLSYQGMNRNGELPKLWQAFLSRVGEIKSGLGDGKSYGLCEPLEESIEDINLEEPNEIKYLAGIGVSSEEEIPQGMEVWSVTHSKYAVFTHYGSVEGLGETYKAIYSDWLPNSGYEAVFTKDFEMYDQDFKPGQKESKMYIYIPIK